MLRYGHLVCGGVFSLDYQERIRALREDSDWKQREIAKILGTSQTMYSQYETGKVDMPLRHLVTLCKFYNVSADYILGFTNRPNPYHIKYK